MRTLVTLSLAVLSFAVPSLAMLSLAAPSHAAELGTLTLDEAVELALDGNLALMAAREDYESARWGLRGAKAALFPSVGLSSTARRVDPETYERANASLEFAEDLGIEVEPFLYETTYETGFYLNVPIWNGGRLWGAVGAAGAGRDAAMHAYESARRATVVEAKTAYFDVLRAESLLGVQEDAVEAARLHAETAERRHEVGLISEAELLRWRVMLAQEERGLADAEGAVVLARTSFLNVLGHPLDAAFSLDAVPDELLDEALARYEAAVDVGPFSEARDRHLLSDNPDFLALSATTRASESNVAIARGAFLPSLNASGSYGWKADDDIDPDDETAWAVTVAVDLPLFTSFKNLSDYQSSKRAYLAAVRRQEEGERGIMAALRSARAGVESSLKGFEAARLEHRQTTAFVKSVWNMYSQGMASYTEVVDAEVLNDRSRIASVNALFDCLTSLAEMERLLGGDTWDATGDDR